MYSLISKIGSTLHYRHIAVVTLSNKKNNFQNIIIIIICRKLISYTIISFFLNNAFENKCEIYYPNLNIARCVKS